MVNIVRLNELPEGSGSLSNDDIFLFMDDPNSGGTTKKISLSQIANIVGSGGGNPFDQNLNTTDFPTFSGINLTNNSSLAEGSFDNGVGGNNGISLNCVVGYELNWQAGHLKCTQDGGITSSNIILDSPLQFSDNVIICSTSDNLLLKYAAAKLLTPNGNSLSSANRATLIIMPGVYPLSEQWEIDGEFVDVIGLGSSSLDRGCTVSVTVTDYDINVSANDVKIKGIGTLSDRMFKIDSDKPLQVFSECVGGENSFGGGSVASGTFTNCTGGDGSFGGIGGTASGSFNNCVGGFASFGSGGTANGSFNNCIGSAYSFGGIGYATGIFNNCVGEYGSFGGDGIATGTFNDCVGGNGSFGGGYYTGGTASGTFTNCSALNYSFGGGYETYGGVSDGTFTNCSALNYSFGGGTFGGVSSGTFTNCTAGVFSFGGGEYVGTTSGIFLRCNLTNGSFPTLSGSGKMRLCIDGNLDVVNADAPSPE